MRLVLLVCILSAFLPGLASGQRITLQETACVKGLFLLCGDVAEIEGNPPWRAARIGKTPLPGTTIRLDRATIERRLSDACVDIGKLEWLGAEAVEITTETVVVNGEELLARGRDFLAGNLPWPAVDSRCDLLGEPPCALTLPAPRRQLQLDAHLPPTVHHKGRLTVEICVAIDGQVVRTVSLCFQVRVWQNVLVTTAFVPRNTALSAAHVNLRRMETTHLVNEPLPADGKENWQSRCHIGAGQVLTFQNAEQMPDVRRGAIVTIVFEAAGLKVTVPAKSLDSGRAGEIVRVLNLATNRIVKCRVVDASTVALIGGE